MPRAKSIIFKGFRVKNVDKQKKGRRINLDAPIQWLPGAISLPLHATVQFPHCFPFGNWQFLAWRSECSIDFSRHIGNEHVNSLNPLRFKGLMMQSCSDTNESHFWFCHQ